MIETSRRPRLSLMYPWENVYNFYVNRSVSCLINTKKEASNSKSQENVFYLKYIPKSKLSHSDSFNFIYSLLDSIEDK